MLGTLMRTNGRHPALSLKLEQVVVKLNRVVPEQNSKHPRQKKLKPVAGKTIQVETADKATEIKQPTKDESGSRDKDLFISKTWKKRTGKTQKIPAI